MSRFTLYSSQSQDLVSSTAWDDNLETYFTHLFNQAKGARTVWWLDVCDATEDDVNTVAQALSVHPLSVEDIATREPREKVEVFRNYYLISFQTLVSKAEDKDEQVSKTPSSAVFFILVFMNGVLTFSPSGCSHVHRVRDRIRKMYDPAILSSDWICYALMYISLPWYMYRRTLAHKSRDDIVDSFAPHMQAASRESEAIEDQVFIVRADDIKALIPRVDHLRKKIMRLMRALSGKIDVLNGFVKRCQSKDFLASHPGDRKTSSSPFSEGDMILYLDDVHDHLVTTMSNLAHFDEIVGRSQSNCLAQLSATNLRLSLTINTVMSRVTVLATIFVPLHLITGLFGMNVQVPGEDAGGLAWFFGIVGLFLAFTVVSCVVAARFQLL